MNINKVKAKRRKPKTLSAETSSNSENETVILVEGMMCEHCERRVKNCLEAIDGIESASADFKTKKVVLNVSKEPDIKVIKAEIKKAGYKFLGSDS